MVFLAVVPLLGPRGLSRVLILWDKSQGKESKSMFGWREVWLSFVLTSCVESGLGNYCFKLNQVSVFFILYGQHCIYLVFGLCSSYLGYLNVTVFGANVSLYVSI